MSLKSKKELPFRMQSRYLEATREQKGEIIDGFVAATGYHRKYAASVLSNSSLEPAQRTKLNRARKYDAEVFTTGHYPSLGGFYDDNSRYTSGTVYPTNPAQDQAAKDSASNYSASDYKPFKCNCADFVEAGMNAAGISTHDSFGPNIPVRLTGSGGFDISPPVSAPDPPHGPIPGGQ